MSSREKIGRNESCPCGSGLKYKRCCLTGASALAPDPESAKRLQRRLEERSETANFRFFNDVPAEQKLSRRIMNIANKLCDFYAEQLDKKIIETVIISWNLAVAKSLNMNMNFSDIIPAHMRSKGFDEVMSFIMKMKDDMYQDDTRLIVEYDVEEGRNGITLNVAAADPRVEATPERHNPRIAESPEYSS